MLSLVMMQEIAYLKEAGYSERDVIEHFSRQGLPPPSKPTIRKYFRMDGPPESPHAKLEKDKAFDRAPFRDTIVKILENNKGCNISSVYDVLQELYVDSGACERLPGNEQTLRNYVKHLRGTGAVPEGGKTPRIYDHVFDTPPGEQMLLDFGQQKLGTGETAHFICMLLRYSRYLVVYMQDHKYNAKEACAAIYRGFQRIGGRPRTLVIDQDAVFVASETYGEVVETEVFGGFRREQELKLWVCNKNDPESKGPIENAVKFVETSFFSARLDGGFDKARMSLQGWLERKNKRIHQAIFRVPAEVFAETEKEALQPLLPSYYEAAPTGFVSAEIKDRPYVLYKSCRYSVPRDCCFSTVLHKAVNGKIHIYNADRRYICSHNISECKGSHNQLPEHKKGEPGRWKDIAERLRAKWDCRDFQHFINGFKKENPRHLAEQLEAVERFLDKENPPKELVSNVMGACCEKYRYRCSQFQAEFDFQNGYGGYGNAAPEPTGVAQRGMDAYRKAFANRCSV